MLRIKILGKKCYYTKKYRYGEIKKDKINKFQIYCYAQRRGFKILILIKPLFRKLKYFSKSSIVWFSLIFLSITNIYYQLQYICNLSSNEVKTNHTYIRV